MIKYIILSVTCAQAQYDLSFRVKKYVPPALSFYYVCTRAKVELKCMREGCLGEYLLVEVGGLCV